MRAFPAGTSEGGGRLGALSQLAAGALHLPAIAVALVACSTTPINAKFAIATAFGAPRIVPVSSAPKFVTAAATGISEQTGGEPALMAALAIARGLLGAVSVTLLMNALRVRNSAVCPFADHRTAPAPLLPSFRSLKHAPVPPQDSTPF